MTFTLCQNSWNRRFSVSFWFIVKCRARRPWVTRRRRERERSGRLVHAHCHCADERASVRERRRTNAVNKTCLLAREPEECNDLRHCDVAFGSADGAGRVVYLSHARLSDLRRSLGPFPPRKRLRFPRSCIAYRKSALNVKITLPRCGKCVSRTIT